MSLLNREETRSLIQTADFRTLFIESLGWDHHAQHLGVSVDGTSYPLVAIAHKRRAVAFECVMQASEFPPYSIRRKIDQQATKAIREHIIIAS